MVPVFKVDSSPERTWGGWGSLLLRGLGHAFWDPAWPLLGSSSDLSTVLAQPFHISEVTKIWKAVTGRVSVITSPAYRGGHSLVERKQYRAIKSMDPAVRRLGFKSQLCHSPAMEAGHLI